MLEYLSLKYKKIALSYVYLLNPIFDLIKFYIIKQQKKYSTFTDEKRDENELLYYLLFEKNAKIIFSMTYSVEFLYDFTFFSMEWIFYIAGVKKLNFQDCLLWRGAFKFLSE